MLLARISGGCAVAVGVLGVPVLHFAAVDLEGKQGAAAYLAHVDDHYVSIAVAGALAVLLAVAMVVHLASLRILAAHRPLLSDATTAVAGFAALGLALSGAAAIMAGYGAHEDFPFEAIRPMGLLAENLFAVLIPAVAATALLLAVLGLRDRALPRWLAVTGAVAFVVLTLMGVLIPGAAAVPSLLWLVISGVGLLLAKELSPTTPATSATRAAAAD
jgi:hypothetical protein